MILVTLNRPFLRSQGSDWSVARYVGGPKLVPAGPSPLLRVVEINDECVECFVGASGLGLKPGPRKLLFEL